MEFRTSIRLQKSKQLMAHDEPVLTAGSCFAATIGKRLEGGKFTTLVNPFGTTYHPLLIHRHLVDAFHSTPPDPAGFLQRQGIHAHYDYHSSIAATTQEAVRNVIASRQVQTATFLNSRPRIILTYGTAWLYRLKETQAPVGNCHQMPSTLFTRERSRVEEIVASFTTLLKALPSKTEFILTVSPVRHLRDGMEENAVSKSILRLACDEITRNFPQAGYFPAFEIMMDDLRDYRFYQPDMIHPTEQASEYIWQHFAETFFSEETLAQLAEITRMQKQLSHKAFLEYSEAHQAFLQSVLKDLEKLSSRFDLKNEIKSIKGRIKP